LTTCCPPPPLQERHLNISPCYPQMYTYHHSASIIITETLRIRTSVKPELPLHCPWELEVHLHIERQGLAQSGPVIIQKKLVRSRHFRETMVGTETKNDAFRHSDGPSSTYRPEFNA
jgi:hypothetical protein